MRILQCSNLKSKRLLWLFDLPSSFAEELDGASLLVARSDGSSAQQPIYADRGIEAIIDGGNVTTENGGIVTFRIRLKSQPLEPVSVPISMGLDSGNETEGEDKD